jgi:hypothetical protein
MHLPRYTDQTITCQQTKKEEGGSMSLDTGCVNWWIIGDYLIGHCKKCGATRDFEKLRQEEKVRMAIRKGKRGSRVISALT